MPNANHSADVCRTMRSRYLSLGISLLASLAIASGLCAEPPHNNASVDPVGDAWHDSRNPIVRIFKGERLDLWSLKPIRSATPPVVQDGGGVRHPIDRFIAARLAEQNIRPADEADRRTLARRLAFDLIGLPLSPERVDEFVNDDRPDAYERLVNELLASPRYGEHAARLWLDVVRHSDSNGFDWDEFRPQAWKFRDYVIRSFNADKPFDQFVREQLAGDELFDGPPQTLEQRDALIATGFLRLGPHDNAAGLFNEQARSRAELMADVVETTGSAFLGLTFSCCRCHDHKYDPLSQADHFRLRAFFEPVRFADDVPLNLEPEQTAIREHNARLDKQAETIQQQQTKLIDAVKQRLRAERSAKLTPEERSFVTRKPDDQPDDVKARIAEVSAKIEPSDADVQMALKPDEKKRHEQLEKSLTELKTKYRSFDTGLLMSDTTDAVPATHVLFQGDYRATREPVVPGFLSVLDPNPAEMLRSENSKTTGRRLTLAQWITSPRNPLTARVLVNRLWQSHFGQGLVTTPNDFGLAGSRPSHPELLDWLATELMKSGWSIKHLRRLIVTSAAYRQESRMGSAIGGDSKTTGRSAHPTAHFARQALRRLTAEQLRDAMLAVSGLLTQKSGGPPVWPELPTDILQANPAFLDDNATKTKGWYPSPREEQHARSIYWVQKRAMKIPFLETFDLPENMVSCACRNTSTVAPQALSLLNSSLAAETAKAMARRVEEVAGDEPDAQIRQVFRLALQRVPTSDEHAACFRLLQRRNLTELCRVLFNLNEFLYFD